MNMPISQACLARLPQYLRYLGGRREQNITSIKMAEDLKLSAVLVRKDLAAISKSPGKPRTGYDVEELIRDLERYLGYDSVTRAVLVGVGHLGKALLMYEGFAPCGMQIVAAFDTNPALAGRRIGGVTVFPAEKLAQLSAQAEIGIITVPREHAQGVADRLVAAGVKGIWNFAPAHLTLPAGIAVLNEDLSASLAILTKRLTQPADKANNF